MVRLNVTLLCQVHLFININYKAMNNLRNRVNLIGNLGADPEVKELETGRKLARISLATTESFKNTEGEQVKNTQWHNLIAWGSTATYAEKYLKKGNTIAVEGKLNHRSYDDQDGTKKYITEVVVNEIMTLRTKESN